MINDYCRFLGLSQSLPVTSYVKMIDIWMLFTMTIPFLEVALHTINEVQSHPGHMAVVKVKPVNKMEDEEIPETSTGKKSKLLRLSGRLVLPVGSLVFTLTFWVVGLIKSCFSGYHQDADMFDCLVFDLS